MKTSELLENFLNHVNNNEKYDFFEDIITNLKNDFTNDQIGIIYESWNNISNQLTVGRTRVGKLQNELKYLNLLRPIEEPIELLIPSVTEPLIIESEPVVPFEEESILEEPETIKEESAEIVPNIGNENLTEVSNLTEVLPNISITDLFSDWDCEISGEFSLRKYCIFKKIDQSNYLKKLNKEYGSNQIKIIICKKNLTYYENKL